MRNVKDLITMADTHFRGLVWLYRLTGFIWNPKRHLKKVPVKEGMVVVSYCYDPRRYKIPIASLRNQP